MRVQTVVIAAALLLTGPVLGSVSLGAAGQNGTITMRDFRYTPDRITVQAGIPVVLTLTNKGKVAHEFMVYDRPKPMSLEMLQTWAERTSYFHGLTVDASGGKAIRAAGDLARLRVAAGKTATLKFTPVRKGTFEMACLIEDHYQAGQRGVFVVR